MSKTADVAPFDPCLAVWANEMRDRATQVFANVVERDAQWAAAVAPPARNASPSTP